MGSKLTETGLKFGDFTTEQTKPVVSVNSIEPDDTGKITVSTPQNFIDRVEALENSLELSSTTYAVCSPLDSQLISAHSTWNFAGIAGSDDGFYIGSNYAIFYYAGAYSIKLHTTSCSGEVPIKITMLSGAGGGAGGYQGQYGHGGRENIIYEADNGSEPGYNAIDEYSQVRSAASEPFNDQVPTQSIPQGTTKPNRWYSKPAFSDQVIDTLNGWNGAVKQGVQTSSGVWPAIPPYNVYWNVYRPRQEATVITGRKMTGGVEYLVYVGSGGDGGDAAGGNSDWADVGGPGGYGGAGGTRGAGENGTNGQGDSNASNGGTAGIGGGKSGATYVNDNSSSVDINIQNTKINKSFDGFGQVGSTGASGDATGNINNAGNGKDTGGGGGGGGGSNGIVLIEWGDI